MPDQREHEPASDSDLHKVVVLLAAMLVRDQESLVEKVRTLEPLGLSTAEIATAAAASEGGVRTTQARLKKSSRRKGAP